jgi:hypothetical protein
VLGEISTKRLVHGRRITKHLCDIGLQEHNVGALPVALVVLAAYTTTEIILWPHIVVRRCVTRFLLHNHDVLPRSLLGR